MVELAEMASLVTSTMNTLSRINKKYAYLEIIANGEYNQVRRVREKKRRGSNKGKSEVFVAKICVIKPEGERKKKSKSHGARLEALKREASILLRLQHESVVVLKEAFHDKRANRYWLVMESLPSHLDMWLLKRALTKVELRVVAKEILDAVGFIHSKGIIHRDLKFENILISSVGRLKLCDFGLAEEFEEGEPNRVSCSQGTLYTKAPELYEIGATYDQSVDIWSVGVLIYLCTNHMYTSTSFFDDENPHGWWLRYRFSNERYFMVAMDLGVFDYKRFPELEESVLKPNYRMMWEPTALQRSQDFREAFDFCLQSVIPIPTSSIKKRYSIKRKDLLRRATLDDLRNSKLILEADKVPESKKQETILGLLQEIEEAKLHI